MQIGFTGTQIGMTESQRTAVGSLLDVLCKNGGHVHHGDCVGADAEFHELAHDRGLRIEIHPPDKDSKRAFKEGDIKWPKYDYRTRNKHIVGATDLLIAAPAQEHEVNRSGTWMTVRMARQAGIKRLIVQPDGKIIQEV